MNRAARLVLFGLVSAWLIKFHYLFELFWQNANHDVSHPLFPRFFEWGVVAMVAYLAPIPCAVLLFLPFTQLRVLCGGVIFFVSSLVLMLHLNGHNDATYVCSFWASLWLIWLGSQWRSSLDRVNTSAIILGHAIVGLVFLGGFVGKLTPEYWSGEALFNIYFLQRETPLYQSIRDSFDPAEMELMAKLLARFAIICEALLACALLMPTRLLCWVGVPIIVGMICVSSYLLYSVLGTMIFLILACHSIASSRSVGNDAAIAA